MSSVLERRREYLRLMRQLTLDNGFFTVTDIQHATKSPRSTAQDWVNRLLGEGCVLVRDTNRGRSAARYVAISAMPSSACRRIFTTIDGDYVEIYHDCMMIPAERCAGPAHAVMINLDVITINGREYPAAGT